MPYPVPLSLTVPKSTPANAPVSVEVHSLYPVIYGGRLVFPAGFPGPAGLLYVRLMTRGYPVYPQTGQFLNGNSGDEFPWTGYLRMEGPPWLLRLEAYNLDDTYPHAPNAYVDCDRR